MTADDRSIPHRCNGSIDAYAPAIAQDANYTRIDDVIYGRKFGLAMTMDIFTPKEKANGKGVIFCVSGGWFSSKPGPTVSPYFKPFLDRGYVVFAVVHGSQPKFTIPEVLEDMHRAGPLHPAQRQQV